MTPNAQAVRSSLSALDRLQSRWKRFMAKLHRRSPRERSDLVTAYSDADSGPPYAVYCDVQLTRRKRHHMITDARGGVVFRSRWWADILEWLANESETEYMVITDRDRYAITSELQPDVMEC